MTSASGGVSALGPGIDTRGPGYRTGGYLLGPGSVTAAGRYTIVNPAPIADLPAWMSYSEYDVNQWSDAIASLHTNTEHGPGDGRQA
ncbi:bifunctional DNA primase/polymerase [Micromonospora chokoriensis]